jgi:methylated-DNA-[protein]-cysteine S-methyltransferase
MRTIYYTYTDSPLGRLLLVGTADRLHRIGFPRGRRSRRPEPGWKAAEAPFRDAIRQLRAYFSGRSRTFDLPVTLVGTPFQRSVWRALRRVPYNRTISYGELARRVGRPGAARAVGAATGRNPLPIVIPCHRVIGADGKLTGFGGGLPAKRTLLDLEASNG